MEKIPTAEEILNDRVYITQDGIEDVHDSISTVAEAMIEFAKLHVEAALKFAAIEATIETINKYSPEEQHIVNHDSILNSYSRKNIK